MKQQQELAYPALTDGACAHSPVTFRRDLGDRFFAYVVYDKEEDREPYSYHWSVQDGSCGRVLEQGCAADAAAAQLRPVS